jgi:ribosomal protein S18 acetylase RimI-like enzyme
VIVRAAVADDAPAMARVHVAAWERAYRGLVADAEIAARTPAAREAMWREVLTGGAIAFVAERTGTVVGLCSLLGSDISALYVDPQHWRTGVGSALLAAGLARLRAEGQTVATLWVLEANDPARAFYTRFGFTPDGARSEVGGAPKVRLRLELG